MEAPEGSRRPSEVLADNVRDYRALGRLSQRALADRMRALGHRWHQQSVSGVEGGTRPVTTDELVSLAVALGLTIGELLDPAGVDKSGTDGFYLGDVDYPGGAPHLDAYWARVIAHAGHDPDESMDRVTFDGEALQVSWSITPDELDQAHQGDSR